MIYTKDNFIDKDLFKIACNYLKKGEFLKHTVGEKDFYVQESPESFDNSVLQLKANNSIINIVPKKNIFIFFILTP